MMRCILVCLALTLCCGEIIVHDAFRGTFIERYLGGLHAIAINLPSRADRWQSLIRSWSTASSVPRIQQFAAMPHTEKDNGTDTILISGCALSHHAAVTSIFAGDPSLPFILVLEDDAVPMPDFDEAFQEILVYAVTHISGWDIINLGSSMAIRGSEVSRFEYRSHRLLRSTVWAATQAMLVNRRAVPAYERMMASVAQHDMHQAAGACDWVLSQDADVVTLLSVPAIVRQSAGWSDIEHAGTDSTALFDEADKWLTLARDGLKLRGWRRGRLNLIWTGKGPKDNIVVLNTDASDE